MHWKALRTAILQSDQLKEPTLILSPLTQHNMQKITWTIANADVKSGKRYVCVERSKKDEQGKSPSMSLNTDTKTQQESCYSGRVVMKIIQVQMH